MPDPKLDKLKKLAKLQEITPSKTEKLEKLKEEASVWETATGLASEFDKGLINTLVTSPVKLGGAIQRTVVGALGYPEELALPSIPGVLPNMEQLGQDIDKGVENLFPTDERINETARGVASGLGQGLAMMAGGRPTTAAITPTATAVPSLLKATGNATAKLAATATSPTGILGGIQSAIPAYEEAKAAGLDDFGAFDVLVKNYLIGQTEAIPLQNMFSRLNKLTGGAILERLKVMGIGSMEEAAQEAIQSYLSNQVARADYDPERDPLFGILESVKVGGIVGFLLPGIASIGHPKLKSKIDQLRDVAVATTPVDATKAAQQDANFEEVTKDLTNVPPTASNPPPVGETTGEGKSQEALPEVQGQVPLPEVEPISQIAIRDISFNETPEFISSDEKVRQLSDAFRQESSPENLAAVNEALQERDNARIAFETKTPGRPIEYVRTTKLQTWKDKFNNINRGIRMGQTDTKAAIKQMGKDLSDFMKGTELSTAQERSILRRATRVNIHNPVQVEKLFRYTENLMKDAQYDERIGKIKDKLKGVKSRLKSNHYTSHSPDVQRLLNLDPTNIPVERLGSYEDVVDGLMKAKVADPRALRGFIDNLEASHQVDEEVTPFRTVKEVQDYVNSIPEVKSIEDFKNAKRKLKSAQNQLQQLANQEVIDDEEAERITQDIEQISSTYEVKLQAFPEEAEAFRKQRILEAKQVLETESDVEFTPRQKEVINKFKSIDLKDATVNEVEDYFRISEGIANGLTNSRLHDYVGRSTKKSVVSKLHKIIKDSAKEFKKLYDYRNGVSKAVDKINPFKHPDQYAKEFKLAHASRFDSHLLLGKERPIYREMFTPIGAKMREEAVDSKAASKMVNETLEPKGKFLGVRYTGLNEEQRIKLGMVAHQIDHSEVRDETQPADLYKYLFNRDESRPNSNKEDAKSVLGTDKVTLMEKIYDSFPKKDGEIDIEKTIASLSPKERAALNKMKDGLFNDSDWHDKVRINNERRGKPFRERQGYFPRFTAQRTSSVQEVQSFVESILTPTKTKTRSASSHERSGEMFFAEPDIEIVAKRFIRDVNRDFYLTEVIRDYVGAMDGVVDTLEGEERNPARAMYDAFKDRVVIEYNYKTFDKTGFDHLVEDYINYRRTMAIANIFRPSYDYAANIVKLVNEQGIGKTASNFLTARDRKWEDVMKMNDSALVDRTSKYAPESYEPDERKGQRMANKVMGFGDVPVIKLSYVSKFKDKFKELTGQEFDLDKIHNQEYVLANKEAMKGASAYATSATEDLFNAQNTFNAPSKTKITPFDSGLTDKRSSWAKILGFMQSYTTNESAQLLQSVKDLRYGTNEGRAKAARRIRAMVLSNYAYQNGSIMMLNALKAIGDDDEEFVDLLREQFDPKKQAQIFMSSIASLSVGRYGNLLKPFLTMMLSVWGHDVKKKLADDGFFNAVNDFASATFFTPHEPVNLYRDNTSKTLRSMTLLGEGVADVYDMSKTIVDIRTADTPTEEEKAALSVAILTNRMVAALYPQPLSPALDRWLKAERRGVKKDSVKTESDLPDLPEPPSLPDLPDLP
jgi:hypothetical protein